MGVKDQMIGILRGSDTARIRFTYRHRGVTAAISAGVFRRVAAGLASGHFSVVEGRFSENKIVYSAWEDTVNDTEANTFYLGSNDRASRDFDALVVHEAVHAYFDVARVTIPWADNESAAYIAQGFYLRNSGFPLTRIDFGEPYRTGYFIADAFVNGVDPSSMIADLRSNLLSDPRYTHYITATFHGNG